MKTTLLIIMLILSGAIGWQLSNLHTQVERVQITGIYPDDRGYTSVMYIQDGKEYGLDYLTDTEYLDFVNGTLK